MRRDHPHRLTPTLIGKLSGFSPENFTSDVVPVSVQFVSLCVFVFNPLIRLVYSEGTHRLLSHAIFTVKKISFTYICIGLACISNGIGLTNVVD